MALSISDISGFEPIHLEEMDAIKLMNRTDTKYLTDEETVRLILSDALREGYRIFEADGQKQCRYDNVYFDTTDLDMFNRHHNRRLVREKVRTRRYAVSGLTFLEVKKKDNHGRTKKKRTEIPSGAFGAFSTSSQATAWLTAHSTYAADSITPSISVNFERITLVNPQKTERLTIDTCVEFKNLRDSAAAPASLGRAAIIELKQDGRQVSRMKGILLDHRVKPFRISKYCMGITMTVPGARSNRFIPKVRTIAKINNSI